VLDTARMRLGYISAMAGTEEMATDDEVAE